MDENLTMDDLIGKKGRRVELHPATDTWMRGDRYGEILSLGRKLVKVKMDRSGRTLTLLPKSIGQVLPETTGMAMHESIAEHYGPPQHMFKVIYVKGNGERLEVEVEAHNFADASWRVANQTFDCMYPSGRQLLDVIQLR